MDGRRVLLFILSLAVYMVSFKNSIKLPANIYEKSFMTLLYANYNKLSH